MEVGRTKNDMSISKSKYILVLFNETGMRECKPVLTPVEPWHKLSDL